MPRLRWGGWGVVGVVGWFQSLCIIVMCFLIWPAGFYVNERLCASNAAILPSSIAPEFSPVGLSTSFSPSGSPILGSPSRALSPKPKHFLDLRAPWVSRIWRGTQGRWHHPIHWILRFFEISAICTLRLPLGLGHICISVYRQIAPLFAL